MFSWRRRATKVLASVWVVTVVFSLGALLWTSHQFPTVWLPWRFLGSLPILDQLGPQRFTAGADLLVAVIVALGLDAVWLRTAHWRTADDPVPGDHRAMVRRGAIGVGLLLVCLGAVIPVWNTYHGPLTTRTTSAPRWVKVLHAAPNKAAPVVVVYPFSMSATLYSQPLVWQSEDGFGFRLVGGYAKVPGPGGHAVSIGAAGSGVRVFGGADFAGCRRRSLGDGQGNQGPPANVGEQRRQLGGGHPLGARPGRRRSDLQRGNRSGPGQDRRHSRLAPDPLRQGISAYGRRGRPGPVGLPGLLHSGPPPLAGRAPTRTLHLGHAKPGLSRTRSPGDPAGVRACRAQSRKGPRKAVRG